MRAVQQRCPVCGKGARQRDPWFPFCSTRCRTQDLANWATGTYSIAAPVSEADEHFEPRALVDESEADG